MRMTRQAFLRAADLPTETLEFARKAGLMDMKPGRRQEVAVADDGVIIRKLGEIGRYTSRKRPTKLPARGAAGGDIRLDVDLDGIPHPSILRGCRGGHRARRGRTDHGDWIGRPTRDDGHLLGDLVESTVE